MTTYICSCVDPLCLCPEAFAGMILVGIAVWYTCTAKLRLNDRMIRRIELKSHYVADRHIGQLLWREFEASGSGFDEVDLWFAGCARCR